MKVKTTCPKCEHEFVMDVPDDSEKHDIECPKCSHSFIIKRTCEDESEDECWWEEHGEPRKTILSSIKYKTNKPIIASFLLLATGVLGIFTAVIYHSGGIQLIPELDFITSNLSLLSFDKFALSISLIIFSIFALVGSVTVFKRRYFVFTAICAVIGIFSIGFFVGLVLSIVALELIIVSRDEFENGTKGKVF
jgi:DNA-directed RNA polymerase subunit RPC12/RpoP